MLSFQVLCYILHLMTQTVIDPSPNILLYIEGESWISVCEQTFQNAAPKMHGRMHLDHKIPQTSYISLPLPKPAFSLSTNSKLRISLQLSQEELLLYLYHLPPASLPVCDFFSPICFIYYIIPSTFRIPKVCQISGLLEESSLVYSITRNSLCCISFTAIQ